MVCRGVLARADAKEESGDEGALKTDVVLQLKDRDVHCHSVVLRARSDLFRAFFGEDEWTRERSSQVGTGHGHHSKRGQKYNDCLTFASCERQTDKTW